MKKRRMVLASAVLCIVAIGVIVFIWLSYDKPRVTLGEDGSEYLIMNENHTSFYDPTIISVTIKPRYSAYGKVYTPEDFNAELIASVRDITYFEDVSSDSFYGPGYSNVLEIKLKNPTYENAHRLVKELKKNKVVESAELSISSILKLEPFSAVDATV